ncbi:MAG TPA: sulfur transferase domain-containing protein [Polyangia bacterium]
MEIVKVTRDLAYADQPSFRELRQLNKQGFRTVVNLRLPTEQLSDEAAEAERAGLRYVRVPIAQPSWSEEQLDAVAQALKSPRSRPALIHSAEGARAGIVALTLHAAEEGWTMHELERVGQTLGLDVPNAALDWLRRHSAIYLRAGV